MRALRITRSDLDPGASTLVRQGSSAAYPDLHGPVRTVVDEAGTETASETGSTGRRGISPALTPQCSDAASRNGLHQIPTT